MDVTRQSYFKTRKGRRMTKVKLLLTGVLSMLFTFLAVASASAYLHLANARSYAVNHVWETAPCYQSSYTCWRYPFYTAYYQRLSDSKVRVEIGLGWRSCSTTKYAYRVFAVQGSDANPSITSSGSAPYWSC